MKNKGLDYLIAFEDSCKIARLRGLPHLVEIGNNTSYIVISKKEAKPKRHSFTCNRLPGKSLAFISKTKRHILKSSAGMKIPEVGPGDVDYIRFNAHCEGEYTDVVEIDVNGAYWRTAYLMGLLSDELYFEGCQVDKLTRLIALGSLAGQRTIYEYNILVDYQYKGVKEDKRLRSLFFLICQRLSALMTGCVNELRTNAFKLFWVDAFIVDNASRVGVFNYLKKNGYACKIKLMDRMVVEQVGGARKAVCFMKNGEKKVFNLSSEFRSKEKLEAAIRQVRGLKQ